MCAAQTAVIAAESLGIGSCYIGDVIERGEELAELLGLPAGTVPLALLVFGHERPAKPGEVSVSCTVDDAPVSSTAAPLLTVTAERSPAAVPLAPPCPRTPRIRFWASICPNATACPRPRSRPRGSPSRVRKFTPHAVANGAPAGERVRKLYHRKHTSDFMAE